MAGTFKDRVTIYEVAKASGVSLATVSRVINKQSNVTEATRKKVEDTIARLGYKPSALAQGLATNRTTNIGIVIPTANYVYISNMLSGMVDIAKIYGYQTTLFGIKHSKEDASQVIEKLITSHVDGAVIFDDELSDEDILHIESYKIPVVVIGHKLQGDGIASIMMDYDDGLKEAINDHANKSSEKMTFVTFSHAGLLMNTLQNTFVEESKRLKVGDEKSIMFIEDSYDHTLKQFEEYFETYKGGCFIVPRDSLAIAVVNAALNKGLKVPQDVEVISVIGTKYSKIARPQISSLNMDMFEVGSIAMRMVTKLLKDDLDTKLFTFSANYIDRGSTK